MDLRSLFHTLAGKVGHVEAILAPDRPPLRFGDLARRIEQVRDELAGLGIGRGDRVALILPRGPETAVCSVAVAACATYMIPSAFVHLDSLPLTANGKVDQGALPEPDPGRDLASRSPAATEDATERALCRIWSEVLGRPSVDPDDDFFALGGHSLLAFGIVARVHRDLRAELSLNAIFEAPTVRALAARLRDTPTNPTA